MYGKQFCVPNAHGLKHLPRDALRFGPIELFSAYQFENYNQVLLHHARKGKWHLQQVVKRLAEVELNKIQEPKGPVVMMSVSEVHYDGPLPDEDFLGRQYRRASFRQWTLTCETPNNCVVMLDGSIVVIRNFLQATANGEILVVGNQFSQVENFFEYPLPSCEIGTFKVSGLDQQGDFQAWPLSQVKAKALKFPLSGGKFVISSLNEHATY